MTDLPRAVDETLELLLRFDAALEQGLLAEVRRHRRPRTQPWECEDEASKDLRRLGALVRALYANANELVAIAARYEERREREAG